MPSFGNTSRERLETCHEDIIIILEKVIDVFDFSVIEGIRTAEKQNEYFNKKLSTLDGYNKLSWHQDRFGDGKSRAVDIVPYYGGAQQWNDEKAFKKLAALVFNATQDLLYKGEISHYIEWGGLWTTFKDLPHFQIKKIEG